MKGHLSLNLLGLSAGIAAALSLTTLAMSTAASANEFFGHDRDLIVGGVTVDAGDPIATTTVAIINKTPQGTGLCTGSLIANDMIVTAGHCVGPDKSTMRIVFRKDLKDTGPVVAVQGYARPKTYGNAVNDQDMDDIALIRFEGGLPQGYSTAELLENASDLRDGEEVTLAGYGISNGDQNSDEAQTSAGTLRKVNVNILKAQWGNTEVELDQSRGKGACHGDSGGPAFVNRNGHNYLFGVTSRGPEGKADNCASESIYTNIIAHSKWLKATEAKLRKGTN